MAKTDPLQCHWNQQAISAKLTSCLTGAAMLCIAALSFADRQPGSLSTIKTSPTSGKIEIIHRLHTHDAELGIIAAVGDRTLTLDKLIGRAQLSLYVEEHFLVASISGTGIGAPLNLDLIGAEIDGDFVLVYQEFSGTLPDQFAVQNSILQDVFPDQVNQVNIALGGEVRSLVFRGDDGWQVSSAD